MLAESIAVAVVSLAVLGPGSYLLHTAWRRGGNTRLFAVATLLAMVSLIGWLFVSGASGGTVEERISQFAGAWGILFMVVGVAVIVMAALGWFRAPERKDLEK